MKIQNNTSPKSNNVQNSSEAAPKPKEVLEHFSKNLDYYSSEQEEAKLTEENLSEFFNGVGKGLKESFISCVKRLYKAYQQMPVKMKVIVIGALGYLLTPVDLVPDMIPSIGLLDDIIVMKFCWDIARDTVIDYEKREVMKKENKEDKKELEGHSAKGFDITEEVDKKENITKKEERGQKDFKNRQVDRVFNATSFQSGGF